MDRDSGKLGLDNQEESGWKENQLMTLINFKMRDYGKLLGLPVFNLAKKTFIRVR